ncbi:MAG: thiamine diphosphokinase [Candidatus Syntrophosphaera sp.]
MTSIRKKAWIFTAHSPREIFSSYRSIKLPQDSIVVADNGLERVHSLGLDPDVIVGDMDSVSPDLRALYPATPVLLYPAAKNETDTELAINWCLENNIEKIVICNDLGGRFDHAFALVQNLAMLREKDVGCSVESEEQQMFFLDKNTTLEGRQGCLLSLFAWREEAVFSSSSGLRFPLGGVILTPVYTRGVSNIIDSAKARIRISSGQVLAVLTK